MSANVYSVQDLLVGFKYRSATLRGEIISAEKHPQAVWYDGCDAYLVAIQPEVGIRTQYRTIAVKVGD